jgi:hypothetical protein
MRVAKLNNVDKSHVDQNIVSLDPARKRLDRIVGGRRDNFPRLHVEQRLVNRAFDAIAVEVALRQAGEGVGADIVGRIDRVVDPSAVADGFSVFKSTR